MPDVSAMPIRVIYILGAGRSGSTVLATVLGNHPDVFSVGELSRLHRGGWTEGEYCACGSPGDVCGFWSAVLRQWEARTDAADVASYIALQERFEQFGIRQWLRLAWGRLRHSAALQDYVDQTRQVYEAIAQVSGKRIVVDSSKNPLRAAILSRIPGIDLRIVHLVRDGRAVAWSGKKALSKDEQGGVQHALSSRPVWYSMSFWMLVNLLSGWVKRFRPENAVLVRYEDFVSTPQAVLSHIGKIAGLDLSDVARSAKAMEPMQVGHIIAGNRLRMAGSVRLQADWEWTRLLPSHDRRICWAIAGWLLQRYQYRRKTIVPL